MTTALVKRELTPDVWGTIEKVAPTMQKSRLFGVATVEQAAAIMLKGYELGLSMTASFEFVHIIQDRPSLSPRSALALIIQSGECEKLQIEDLSDEKGNPTACHVTMKRRNGIEYIGKYSMDDARKADLVKPNSGWSKYPANMLRWRAIGYAADVVFPDITGGMKRADEFGGSITPDGDVITATYKVVDDKPKSANGTSNFTDHLSEVINRYGADKVLAANNGQVPANSRDLAIVEVQLQAQQAQDLEFTLEDLPEKAA